MLLGSILQKREHYTECRSTNSILTDKINNCRDLKKLSGLYITTDLQTAGRGQGNHRWHTTSGKNLLISFLSVPESIDADKQFAISRITALGIVDLFKSMLPDKANIRIKWPNDIYIDGYKIAGILIENRITAYTLSSSIIGCGLNVNEMQFPKSIPNPISLQQITGNEIPVESVLELFIESFLKVNDTYRCTQLDKIHAAYDHLLFGLHETMEFKDKNGIFQGIIQGTTPSGLLNIQKQQGVCQYAFQEVEYILTKRRG